MCKLNLLEVYKNTCMVHKHQHFIQEGFFETVPVWPKYICFTRLSLNFGEAGSSMKTAGHNKGNSPDLVVLPSLWLKPVIAHYWVLITALCFTFVM